MGRQLPACALILALVNALPAAAAAPDTVRLLPPNATIRVTKEADITGDGRPETIIGYTLPRAGLPPTEGRAAVLERDATGSLRRLDLVGGWPGHYPPAFTVTDLTGDGRPELVVQAAGGGAWGILRVFSRAKDAYESLLLDAAQDHVLWDADGDGVQEVIARYRTGSQSDQVLQRFIWRNGRFVAWHAQAWSYVNGPTSGEALPGLTGLTLQQAHQSVSKAGLNLGVIAVLDAPGPGGRVVRNRLCDGQVDLAVSAGDTRLTAPPLPQVASAHYRSGTEPGTAPVAMTEVHRDRWRQWLQHLVAGAQQVVYTGTLSKAGGPVYLVELASPWRVVLGGRAQLVRWIGVGTGAPHRGLLFLAPESVLVDDRWPRFTAALYTPQEIQPFTVAAPQPLRQYLSANPEVDAFVTLWPSEWAHAVRLRGIESDGWPEPQFAPHLEGPANPDPETSPDPDHVMVTVLNGFVRRAVRNGDEVRVTVTPAPGRAYVWPLPLTGFNRSTRVVRVRVDIPGHTRVIRQVPLDSWRSWAGDPGPGSLDI